MLLGKIGTRAHLRQLRPMMRVGPDGVPSLIQSVRYEYGNHWFVITFFDDTVMHLGAGDLVDTFLGYPQDIEISDAVQHIQENALELWQQSRRGKQ